MEHLIIGITGGIGSGKTTFAKLIQSKGYKVIFTDELAKKIISDDIKVRDKLLLEFGKNSFIEGVYNSEYISTLVFSDKNKLNKLNQIVFPAVIDALIKEIELIDNDNKIIFVESALLYEFEMEDGFDYIISVSSKLTNRINRIKERNNLTDKEIENRINSQMSQEEKNKLADFIVENDNLIDELNQSAEFLLNIIAELPNRVQER